VPYLTLITRDVSFQWRRHATHHYGVESVGRVVQLFTAVVSAAAPVALQPVLSDNTPSVGRAALLHRRGDLFSRMCKRSRRRRRRPNVCLQLLIEPTNESTASCFTLRHVTVLV